MKHRRAFTILLADSDPDEYHLLYDALAQNGYRGDLQYASDAEELMAHLRSGRVAPSLILLELNLLGGEDGEALSRLQADPSLRHIPVVVMTTSSSPEDVARSYALGARSHVDKPLTMDEQVRVVGILLNYWMDAVIVPEPSPQLQTVESLESFSSRPLESEFPF
ncbi:MAG: response regulator [Deltaproteobacteria bacterium]|nr:response regulator [Deltaproteobacteria bacterium]